MLKRIFVFSVVLTAWFGFSPGNALCQGRTWAGESLAQMVEAARWRIGDFRVNASLALANAGYDTDIYFGYLDEAVPDYTFSVSVPIQVLLPLGKKVVVDLFETPQYVFYLETEKERAWNNIFRGQVHFALERFYIQVGGGLSNIRQRLSPELNVNIRQKEDSLNGTLLWQTSQEISLAVLYGGARYDYGDAEFGGTSLAETLNRTENYFDFITYIQPNSEVRFFVNGQYGTYSFTGAASNFKDTRSYGVFGGVAFVPREGEARPVEPIQGDISFGYKRFDILDPLLVDGSGFVGAANVTAGLFSRTAGRAFFSRDFAFSASSSSTFYMSTTYGGGISGRLTRRMTLSYDLSFSRTSYPEAEDGEVPVGRGLHYTSHSFSLDLSLARNLRVTFQCLLSRREMNDLGLVRNRNFFGFSLVYGFPTGSISTPMRGLVH